MKIRKDFVTNSSSSSFILAFDEEELIDLELEESAYGEYLDELKQECKEKRYSKTDSKSQLFVLEKDDGTNKFSG